MTKCVRARNSEKKKVLLRMQHAIVLLEAVGSTRKSLAQLNLFNEMNDETNKIWILNWNTSIWGYVNHQPRFCLIRKCARLLSYYIMSIQNQHRLLRRLTVFFA